MIYIQLNQRGLIVSNQYFGGSVEISEFFKDFKSFTLDGTVSDSVWGKHPREHSYNLSNLPDKEFIPCTNPQCRKGGYSIIKILDKLSLEDVGDVKKSLSCSGDVGGGQSCTYSFNYSLDWEK